MKRSIILISIIALGSIGGAQAQNYNRYDNQQEMQELMSSPNFDERRAKEIIKNRNDYQLEQMKMRHQNFQQGNQNFNNRAPGMNHHNNMGRGGRGSGMRGGNAGNCLRY